jgi:peptidyl-prolyl cis-trans isomerase B (cyclophilin B)
MLKSKLLTAALCACLIASAQTGAIAEKTNPDMIPPDVTFPNPNAPQAPTATQSTASAAAAAAPAPETPAPGQGAPPQQQQFNPATAGIQQPPASAHQGNPRLPIDQRPPVYPGGTPATAANESRPDPLCVIETNKGVIMIRLFRKQAPRTVAHFMELVQAGFYNGLTFHRVEPGFVIQGGCPNGDGSGLYSDAKTGKPKMVALETSGQLSHNAAGVVALARFPKNPNSASCQFYITLQPQPRLDHQYSIFGGVLNGMDVVQHIQKGDKMISLSLREQ